MYLHSASKKVIYLFSMYNSKLMSTKQIAGRIYLCKIYDIYSIDYNLLKRSPRSTIQEIPMQLKNINLSRAVAEDAWLLPLKIWLRKNYRYNFLGSILSTAICTYVPIQRCHIFVAGYVLPSFSYTVSKYQLRRAARAVLAEVPYPCCRISGSTQQLRRI